MEFCRNKPKALTTCESTLVGHDNHRGEGPRDPGALLSNRSCARPRGVTLHVVNDARPRSCPYGAQPGARALGWGEKAQVRYQSEGSCDSMGHTPGTPETQAPTH